MTTAADKILQITRNRSRLPRPAERRRLREGAGLTQAELAAALEVSAPTIVRWESGKRKPRGRNLDAYVQVLEALGLEQ
jgi:DNA-binding transcriptional regulator YiaG